MKNFKFMYGVLALFLIAVGCGKDNETPTEVINELKTEATELIITEKESKSVKITSGNGAYKVASSDDKVATATVKDNTVSVEAKKAGTAKITLSDSKNKSLTINVMVDALIALEDLQQPVTLKIGAEKTIVIKSGTGSYKVVADNDNVMVTHENNTLKIVAQKAGKSKITITDTKTNKTVMVDVVVEQPDLGSSVSELVVTKNTSKTVTITSGSGQYEVTSSNESIATASRENQTITINGIKEGTTTITVKDTQSNQTKEITVKVVEQLSLGGNSLTIFETGNEAIEYAGSPTTFISKDPSIATASIGEDMYGTQGIVIKGISPGKTTVDISDGDTTITVNVTVKKAADLALVGSDKINLSVGGYASVSFFGSNNINVTNSDAGVATAEFGRPYPDENQIWHLDINAKKAGTSTVTIKDNHNNKTITISITVQ
ncbi:pilus assembly protein N-terminal domain-containing protein [Capnocytophaga sp.]|uniref:pilus assembly protein N-terminal domain-containing protein n=1 Tax=Capnocytophaga sp. TaxID=44737 RepID=UPI0026DCEE22|nr:pilus assembly protein N-terminal domain-containing protein [Capnocytophaga sp.]MDO5104724.1 pilus assembly protein N-terminal domain-containing protein [Capnocytophaga sp.]